MDNVGYAALQIIPSFKGLDKNLEQGTSKALLAAGTKGGTTYGDSAGRSAGRRFASVFGSVAKAGLVGIFAGGALLGAAAFKLGKDSLEQASDLNESLNAVAVTYGEQTAAVRKLGFEAAESLGLSQNAFNGLAVQFSAFATQIAGGEGPKVVGVLDELTTRGADFASVMNLEVNESLALFQSGLAGETEPLRKFGIDLSAAAVTAHAYKTGIAEAGDELTEGQKVQARYSLLMKQTAKTQGDFTNTSSSLANQTRILSARWDNARAKLGIGLLPVITDATRFLNDKGIPAFERFADWFRAEGGPALSEFIDDAKPIAKQVLPELVEAFGTVKEVTGEALVIAKDLIEEFNNLPDWAKKAIVGGGIAVGAGAKLGIKPGTAVSGAGKLLSSAKPVPVFVTNPGFGTDGIGGGKGGKTPSAAAITRTGGLASIPLLGALFVDKVTPTDHLNSAAPSTGGFAGNAGATVPPGTKLDDLSDPLGIRKAFGLDEAAAEAKQNLAVISAAARENIAETAAQFDTLPSDLKTDIVVNGAPESRKQVMDLVREYDLTPKEKRTLFKVYNIADNKRTVNDYIGVLSGAEGPRNATVNVYGVDEAAAKVRTLTSLLNSIPGLSGLGTAVQGAINDASRAANRGGGGGGGRSPRRGPASRGREGVYGDLDRLIDERIGAHNGLATQRGRAS